MHNKIDIQLLIPSMPLDNQQQTLVCSVTVMGTSCSASLNKSIAY